MRRVSWAVSVFLGGLALGAASPAFADISVGTNLGLTIHKPENGDQVTLIGIPSQSNALSLVRPGLRVGFAGEKRDHEFYADVSFDRQSSDGDSFHATRFAANYQYNFGTASATRPYVTVGAGIFNAGSDFGSGSAGATSTTFGGGLGLGVPLSEEHGRFRMEARFDRLGEGEDDGFVLIGAANLFSFVAGFDLWM